VVSFTPLSVGELPRLVRSFFEPYGQVFPSVVDAWFRGDKRLALQALRMDPVCAHLNGEEFVSLGERLLGAHRAFVTAF
jgi:alpha-galactosidase/6-phospho-beta-glucosidase family protein